MVVINTPSTSWHLAGEQMNSMGQWQIQMLGWGGGSKRGWSQSRQSWVPWLCSWFIPHEGINLKSFESVLDSHQHSWAHTMGSDSARGAKRTPLVCVQLVSSVTLIYCHFISYHSQTVGLTSPWWGDFLHCTHRSWESNIPLWQQWGEVMNNLRLSALALPSLRKQSACCLGRWLENMFIAARLATEGGRWEWGRGGRGGGSHTSLLALSFSLEGHTAIPPGYRFLWQRGTC